MVWALLVISIIVNVALTYSAIITLKKLEQFEDITEEYESRIMWFYETTSDILATARRLDQREMFENDDEVGQLFNQLIDTTGELRKLIYDTEETEEEESLLDR
tara:strand:+ start:4537 stop:4848 length:312 start_codon:yes stop_codon:yes gene_type:complete